MKNFYQLNTKQAPILRGPYWKSFQMPLRTFLLQIIAMMLVAYLIIFLCGFVVTELIPLT